MVSLLGIAILSASLAACTTRDLDPAQALGVEAEIEWYLGHDRLLRPMLAADRQYVECPSPFQRASTQGFRCWSGGPLTSDVSSSLARLGARIAQDLARGATVDRLRDAAHFALLSPPTSAAATREALGYLQTASEAAPDDAGLRADLSADLAATFLVLAEETGNPVELLRALDAAEAAVALHSRHAPAHFNRALALTALGSFHEAGAAWETFADLAPSLEWGDVAAERSAWLLSSNRQPRIDGARERASGTSAAPEDLHDLAAVGDRHAREVLLWEILPRWADSPANPLGVQALEAGRELARASGDPALIGVVSAIIESDTPQRDVWSELFSNYGAGAPLVPVRAFDDAIGPLERALAAAEHLDDQLVSPWIRIDLALARLQRGEFDVAGQLLDGVESDSLAQAGYGPVRGRVRQLWGTIHLRTGRSAEAQQGYREAIEWFDRAGEDFHAGSARMLVSDPLRLGGAFSEASKWLLDAERSLLETPDITWRQNTALAFGLIAEALGLPLAAVAIQREAISITDGIGEASMQSQSRHFLAPRVAAIGDTVEAIELFQAARRFTLEAREGTSLARTLADLDLAEGGLLAGQDPERALDLLSSAHARYEDLNLDWHLFRARVARARAQVTAGRNEEARELLRTAGNSALSFAARAGSFNERAVHLRTNRPLYADLTSLEVALGDTEASVFTSELLRPPVIGSDIFRDLDDSRDLVDALAGFEARLTGVLASRDRAVFLGAAFLGDQLYLWARKHGSDWMTALVDGREAESLVARWQLAVPGAEEERLAGELYRQLLGTFGPLMADTNEIVWLPDGALHRLPLGAVAGADGVRLEESHIVRRLPSMWFAAPPTSTERRSVLAMSVPEVDGRPELANADSEVQGVAPFYESAEVITGGASAADLLRGDLSNFDVVHFAGHALALGAHPDSSYLVATDHRSGREVRVSPAELAKGGSAPALVVLSSCTTMGTAADGTVGPSWFAAHLMSRGSQGIVVSLWPVDDEATEQFMLRFHEALQRGEHPADALRSARRAGALDQGAVRKHDRAFVYIGN